MLGTVEQLNQQEQLQCPPTGMPSETPPPPPPSAAAAAATATAAATGDVPDSLVPDPTVNNNNKYNNSTNNGCGSSASEPSCLKDNYQNNSGKNNSMAPQLQLQLAWQNGALGCQSQLPNQHHQQQQQQQQLNRIGFRHAQVTAWSGYHESDAQLESLESMAKTLLAGSGLGFAECAAQEMAARLVQPDCPAKGFEQLLGDPAANRNLPELGCLPGLAGLLSTALDSDATDSDSQDGSLVGDGEDSTAAAPHSEATLTALREREAWFKLRAQLLTRWQWVSQQMGDVDCRLRAYADLCDRLSAKPWRFDPGDSVSRCVPAPQQLLAGGRRRVRLLPPRLQQQQQQQQQTVSSASSLIGCSCAPPLPGCALCGGWRSRRGLRCPGAPLSERCALLDPGCHRALGPAADRQDVETAVSSIFRKKRSVRQRQQQLQPSGVRGAPQGTSSAVAAAVASDALSQGSGGGGSSGGGSSVASSARRRQRKHQHQQQQHHLLHQQQHHQLHHQQAQQPQRPLKVPTLVSSLARPHVPVTAQPPLTPQPQSAHAQIPQLHHHDHHDHQQDQQPHQKRRFSFNGGDLAEAPPPSPSPPAWTPPRHPEPRERREIATPQWQLTPELPPPPPPLLQPASAEIRVYAKLAKPSFPSAAAAAANGASSAPPLRLCSIQETPGMSEDLTDAAFYMRHRPCEKSEHVRNWGRQLRLSPVKTAAPALAAAASGASGLRRSDSSDAYNPGFLPRRFPVHCDEEGEAG